MTNPKIYVGTYAKYNAGDLSGDWLSLRDFETYEDLIEACMELHSDEADPELMIQDCDDMPDGLTVGESISREEFDDIKKALQEESAGVPAYSIIDYSDKAIAVTGDTRKIAAELRSLGGRFNSRLSCGPGWIFSARKRAEIESLLAGSRTDTQARPETAANEGRKTLEEWANVQRDPDYIMKAYDSAVKLSDGVVLFDHPKIKTEFCFRDEGPDYEFYKELGSDENLLRDYFIRENMDQNGIAEPNENTDMYIVKYAGEYRPGRVYVQFCNCPEYLNLRREDTIRIATDTERSLYLAELARVRKAFRKRLDTYLKRYGISKLHIWSYWADA